MYFVRVSFTNRYGSPYHFDFQLETDDYAEAISEAITIFLSGLTFEEQRDAAQTLSVMAHPNLLPYRTPANQL
jgi:hypothetical protein